MYLSDIITLSNAGFTKDEIMSLVNAQEAPSLNLIQTEEPSAQKVEATVPSLSSEPIKMQTVPEVKPSAEVAATSSITDEQIKKLAQLINVNNAQIDVPPTRTVDDILSERFTSLMVGEKKTK